MQKIQCWLVVETCWGRITAACFERDRSGRDMNIFRRIHDPTNLNRQGAGRGEQYRSVIFCHTPEQTAIARSAKARLEHSRKYDKSIVTQIQPASEY